MFDAVVVAGGGGRRLGGVDKSALTFTDATGTATLLDLALAAVRDAARTIVVGPERELPPGVELTSERPPGGGPAAAVEAGVRLVRSDHVVVLAGDLPFVSRSSVARLVSALAEADPRVDGIALVDRGGRRQPLYAAYRTAPLRAALASAGEPVERPAEHPPEGTVERGVGGLQGVALFRVVDLLVMHDLAAEQDETFDCDTWADVDAARLRLGHPRTDTDPPTGKPPRPDHAKEP